MSFDLLNRKFRRKNIGATAIEYALIASLIAIVAIGALKSVGKKIGSTFGIIDNTFGETHVQGAFSTN